MSIRSSICIATITVLAAGCASASNDESSDQGSGTSQTAAATNPQPRSGGHVGVHGMNLFGSGDATSKLYLSHIPLYDSPHNLQVIVEVKIASGVPDGQAQFATRNFTVRPSSAFSLDDLAQGTLHSITGNVFMGNFESGGSQAFRSVKFDVQRVIFQHGLSNTMPSTSTLDYIAVGTPTQAFLVHVIDAAPNYEQIVHIKAPPMLDSLALETGTPVRVVGGQNGITNRLKPSSVVNVSLSTDHAGGGTRGTSSIQVLEEDACLPGPDFFGTCPAAQ
jgi:hypothetical protein